MSSQFLTNQEPVQLVQRNFSHLICLESFLYISRNWQEIFPELNTIKDKGQVPDYAIQVLKSVAKLAIPFNTSRISSHHCSAH